MPLAHFRRFILEPKVFPGLRKSSSPLDSFSQHEVDLTSSSGLLTRELVWWLWWRLTKVLPQTWYHNTYENTFRNVIYGKKPLLSHYIWWQFIPLSSIIYMPSDQSTIYQDNQFANLSSHQLVFCPKARSLYLSPCALPISSLKNTTNRYAFLHYY